MPNLLDGKCALILGVANKWSLAYAIAQAFVREGASIVLTYQGERLRGPAEELGNDLHPGTRVLNCDVTKDDEIVRLADDLSGDKLDVVVHSIAFANPEDLSRPFVQTSRAGYLLAQEISSYSLVAISRAM